jgi:hypothetical protein
MEITGSMMRKIAEQHKTAGGNSCIQAIVSTDGRSVKFVGHHVLKNYTEEQVVTRFSACPVCGKKFDEPETR